jgi:hypothetical protein
MNGHYPAWRVGGSTGIKKEHVNLIGLVQVSQGSWQPILQLNRFIMSGSGDHGVQSLSAPTGEIERILTLQQTRRILTP